MKENFVLNTPFKTNYLYIYHRLYVDKASLNLNNNEGNFSEHKKTFIWVGDELEKSPEVSVEMIKRNYAIALVFNGDGDSIVKETLNIPDAIAKLQDLYKNNKDPNIIKEIVKNDYVLDINGFLLTIKNTSEQPSKDGVIIPTVATVPIIYLDDNRFIKLGDIDSEEISLSLGSGNPLPYHIERVYGAVEFETVVKLNYIAWVKEYCVDKNEMIRRLKALCKSAVSEEFLIGFGKNKANPRMHIIALTTKRIYLKGEDPLITAFNTYLKNIKQEDNGFRGVFFISPEHINNMDRIFNSLKNKPEIEQVESYTDFIKHIQENYEDFVKIVVTIDHDRMKRKVGTFLDNHIINQNKK